MTARRVLLTLNQSLALELAIVLAGLTDHQILYRASSIDARCIRDVAIHAHRPVLAIAAVVAGYE